MKVAIYSLTRDRLDYTKHCFATLQERAGWPFDHFVLDNGSSDGTAQWLSKKKEEGLFKEVIFNSTNQGISYASNQCLDAIGDEYDLIIKVDNDCELVRDDTLGSIVSAYGTDPYEHLLLSPRVDGLRQQPHRYEYTVVNGFKVGLTIMIGGIFAALPSVFYQQFRFNYKKNAFGAEDDVELSEWVRKEGGLLGYLEDINVCHYETTDGQVARYPEYFQRKNREERSTYPHAD